MNHVPWRIEVPNPEVRLMYTCTDPRRLSWRFFEFMISRKTLIYPVLGNVDISVKSGD
jgi:hypothetical protein